MTMATFTNNSQEIDHNHARLAFMKAMRTKTADMLNSQDFEEQVEPDDCTSVCEDEAAYGTDFDFSDEERLLEDSVGSYSRMASRPLEEQVTF